MVAVLITSVEIFIVQWSLYYKNFYGSNFSRKLECLSQPFPSTLFWYLRARLELTTVELLKGLNPNGCLPALPPNIRLKWRRRTLGNPLTYYEMAKIYDVKRYIVQAFGACTIKLFTAVIVTISK
jgi:hypothetical protein